MLLCVMKKAIFNHADTKATISQSVSFSNPIHRLLAEMLHSKEKLNTHLPQNIDNSIHTQLSFLLYTRESFIDIQLWERRKREGKIERL